MESRRKQRESSRQQDPGEQFGAITLRKEHWIDIGP